MVITICTIICTPPANSKGQIVQRTTCEVCNSFALNTRVTSVFSDFTRVPLVTAYQLSIYIGTTIRVSTFFGIPPIPTVNYTSRKTCKTFPFIDV